MGRFDKIFNYFKPNTLSPITPIRKTAYNGKRISQYIAPFQFERFKQDIGTWREAISEAEQAWYPHRVKMQRIYQDTILNGHVIACIRKRKNMVLLKEFGFYNGEVLNDQVTKELKNEWFYNLMNYAIEAELFGYSGIELGDLVNNEFPELTIVKRENISPDRLIVSSLVYSTTGIQFMNPELTDEEGNKYCDWFVYVDTPSDKGASICGYGLLYEVAPYEILLRNLQAFNSDYAEIYGQPLKHAKSNKLEGPEYDNLEAALQNMASNSYLLTDHETDLEFVSPTNGSSGFQVFSNFEERLEKKISKIILGHGSAMDAVPGKLGSNDDIKQALREIETVDCRRIEHVINRQVIPKLLAIGFPIPKGTTFKFKNDKELLEIREAQDASNKVTADIFKTIKDAGGEPDWKYFSDRTGIPVEKTEEIETGVDKKVQNRIREIYDNA